jgi:hypothetical protein
MTGKFFGDAKSVWVPLIGGLRLCALWLQRKRNSTTGNQSGERPSCTGNRLYILAATLTGNYRSRHNTTRIMASTCMAYVKYPGCGTRINAPRCLRSQNFRSLELMQTASRPAHLACAPRQPSDTSGRRIPAIQRIVKDAQRLRQEIEIRALFNWNLVFHPV